jgi:hypothetical protein
MNPVDVVSTGAATQAGGANFSQSFPMSAPGSEDAMRFQDALSRNMAGTSGMFSSEPASGGDMLGKKLMGRAHDLASNLMQDQQHVSKMLEQASRTGDSMQLMKAMMALNDYQVRVQTVSKTVSKAASSIDQLTKLQ